MGISHHHLHVGFRFFFKEILGFIRNPVFIVITILGNSAAIVGATAFYWLEKDLNPGLGSFFDSFYWAMMTVTTVGYGDIVPQSLAGKVVTILLTLIGTGLFLAYVALLSATFMNLEVSQLEKEVQNLKKGFKKINRP